MSIWPLPLSRWCEQSAQRDAAAGRPILLR
jgi:hypothetical protein